MTNNERGATVGHRRVPMWGAGLVLVSVLGAACASASDPPPPTVPKQATSPSGTICRVSGTLTELSVTRTDPFPQNHISYVFPGHVVSTDATAVAAVAVAACGLPVFPPVAYSCPLDVGVTYTLTFLARATEVGTVTADPTGCPSLTGLGPTRATNPGFWDRLAVALGLPAPREYCDPFRGRLPTAPSPCGPAL